MNPLATGTIIANNVEMLSCHSHCSDVTMSIMGSQITGISTVCSTICLGQHKKIKARVSNPLWGESTRDRWIPFTKGQWRIKRFHVVTSSCERKDKFLCFQTSNNDNQKCSTLFRITADKIYIKYWEILTDQQYQYTDQTISKRVTGV